MCAGARHLPSHGRGIRLELGQDLIDHGNVKPAFAHKLPKSFPPVAGIGNRQVGTEEFPTPRDQQQPFLTGDMVRIRRGGPFQRLQIAQGSMDLLLFTKGMPSRDELVELFVKPSVRG